MKTRLASHDVHEKLSTFIHRRAAYNYLNDVAEKYMREREWPMAVYANDWIGINIFTDGVYERYHLDCILSFFLPFKEDFKNWTVLDIGANIGNHTLYFARQFGKIHAFEPSDHTYQLLSFNTNRIGNIELHNFGLGEGKKKLSLYENDMNYGASSTVHKKDEFQRVQEIEIRRLDDLDIDLTGLQLIKVDVEGMELSVFRGGIETIKKHMPIILFEQNPIDFSDDEPGTKSTRYLADLGYKFCWVELKLTRGPWLYRKFLNFIEIFKGRKMTFEIMTGPEISGKSHDMLIALPPRFLAPLLERG